MASGYDYNALDPDQLAQLVVMQYCNEHGLTSALQALESDLGYQYDDAKLPRGAVLMEMVWKDMEERMSKDASDLSTHAAEEEELLRGGKSDYPTELTSTNPFSFPANIIDMALCSDAACDDDGLPDVLVASGDGNVRRLGQDGAERWCTSVASAAALSVVPAPGDDDHRAVATGMDGSVTLLDMRDGSIMHKSSPHRKYVVRAAWAGGADAFVTGSWDGAASVHVAPASEPGFETKGTQPYAAAVQDLVMLPGGDTAVVAVRDTSKLHQLNVRTCEAGESINMNARGDDHVSFWAQSLKVSPCKRFLLICTDTPRILMLRIGTWRHVRSFYDLPREQFHQACATWHPDSMYFYAAAAGGSIWVYHVGSGKAVATLREHDKNVRSLVYHEGSKTLLTAGFTKAIKTFGRSE